jgi:hypothetical protein
MNRIDTKASSFSGRGGTCSDIAYAYILGSSTDIAYAYIGSSTDIAYAYILGSSTDIQSQNTSESPLSLARLLQKSESYRRAPAA